MTDSEILADVGIGEWIEGPVNGVLIILAIFKAMKLARANERVQVGSDINIATITGDLPDICECVADFVVRGKNDT